MKILRLFICLFLLIANAGALHAQSNKIELLGANSLKFDKSLGLDAQRLIGNVRFKHKGALMYCDSAYLYNSSNSLDAFGNVRVVQGDTLTLNSDKLYYDGNTQFVKVRDHVILNDQDMKLSTHTLDYDRKTGRAVFFDRGIITSTQNENELVSCEGIYDSNSSFFFFRDSVVLENPSYRMETDTLNYGNISEVAYFKGPTFIYSDENTIYCENGWYDTKTDISQFNENAYLNNGKQVLSGDSLWYSRNDGVGRAYDNVAIVDTTERVNIYGDYGAYFELIGKTLITGRAELVQYDERDSLFMHGDTLMAISDSIAGDKIYAYNNVKFYRKDMQGAADSVIFAQSDSLIHMYKNPILWSDNLQITGDTIQIRSVEGAIENLYVFDHAFMVNRIDSVMYNQIKGKRLTGYFRNNDLYKVFIRGNGQSLYYAAEEKKVKVSASEANQTAISDSLQIDSVAQTNVNDTTSVSNSPAQQDTSLISATDTAGVANIVADTTLSSNTPTGADSLAQADSVMVRKQTFIGVNKAICSNIAIYLTNNQVQRIVFLNKPDGVFFPLEKFPTDEYFYDGFSWQEHRRPLKREDIFLKEEPKTPVEEEDEATELKETNKVLAE